MFQNRYHLRYFSQKVDFEIKELYWQTALASFALALVFIFEPIYLYSLGYSMVNILWFYAQVYIYYLLLIGFGAKFSSRWGLKHGMIVSNLFYIIYWIVLFSVKANPFFFYIAPLFFALQKAWFWPSFNADMALKSQNAQRGREVGVMYSLIEIVFIIGPLIGGFVSEFYGFYGLFFAAGLFMAASIYPLLLTKDQFPRHIFSYHNLWKIFRKNWQNFWGYWGYAEDMMIMSIWPIFVFIMTQNLSTVGLISTIAAAIGSMVMLYVGKLTDKTDKQTLLKNFSFFYALTWVFRFLTTSVGSVLAFDSLTKIGKDIVHIPVAAVTFENAGEKNGEHALAFSVFYEMSLSVAKLFVCLAGMVILYYTANVHLLFILVGVLTMFYGLLRTNK